MTVTTQSSKEMIIGSIKEMKFSGFKRLTSINKLFKYETIIIKIMRLIQMFHSHKYRL